MKFVTTNHTFEFHSSSPLSDLHCFVMTAYRKTNTSLLVRYWSWDNHTPFYGNGGCICVCSQHYSRSIFLCFSIIWKEKVSKGQDGTEKLRDIKVNFGRYKKIGKVILKNAIKIDKRGRVEHSRACANRSTHTHKHTHTHTHTHTHIYIYIYI